MTLEFSEGEIRRLYGILRKIDFLSTITFEEIDSVIKKFEKQAYKKGRKVVRQGRPGVGLFVIKSGSCLVYKEKGLFAKERLAVLEQGSFFGEMSLVYDSPASATVETLEPSEIYLYPRNDFLELVSKNAALKNNILKLADKRTSENVLGKS